jgi:hypothetical protein
MRHIVRNVTHFYKILTKNIKSIYTPYFRCNIQVINKLRMKSLQEVCEIFRVFHRKKQYLVGLFTKN